MDNTLSLIDFEIQRENFDSERAIKVLWRICVNDVALLAAIWPLALAALVDARIMATEPPKAKPRSVKKKRAARGRQPKARRSLTT